MDFQLLFNSGYKAKIIECGHGAEISNAFLSELNASKFILKCAQPYDKDVQDWEYAKNPIITQSRLSEYKRSVSAEFVRNVLIAEKYPANYKTDKLLIVATSFQLDLDNKGLTHGYVGIYSHDMTKATYTTKIYHLSIYRHQTGELITKKQWIGKIKDDVLNLIEHTILGVDITSQNIDGIWDVQLSDHIDGKNDFVPNLEETLSITQKGKGYENFICIDADNNLIRFEDIIRRNTGENKGLIMQKGSFNPFHRMHNRIAQDAIANYPTFPHVLVLSVHTCDKGSNCVDELVKRIKALTALGYTVMVTMSGQFLDNMNEINDHYDGAVKVVFPVGDDTIERFFRDWEAYFDSMDWSEFGGNFNVDRTKKFHYFEKFKNAEWFIARRESVTKEYADLVYKYAEVLDNFGYSGLELDNISSSAIRKGEIVNEL